MPFAGIVRRIEAGVLLGSISRHGTCVLLSGWIIRSRTIPIVGLLGIRITTLK